MEKRINVAKVNTNRGEINVDGSGEINFRDMKAGISGTISAKNISISVVDDKLKFTQNQNHVSVGSNIQAKDYVDFAASPDKQAIMIAGNGFRHTINPNNSSELEAMLGLGDVGVGGSVTFGNNTLQGSVTVGPVTIGGGHTSKDITYDIRTLPSREIKVIVSEKINDLENQKNFIELSKNAQSSIHGISVLSEKEASRIIEQIDKEISQLQRFEDMELKDIKDNLYIPNTSARLETDVNRQALGEGLDRTEYLEFGKVVQSVEENTTQYDAGKIADAAAVYKKSYYGEQYGKMREHAINRYQSEEGIDIDSATKYIDEKIEEATSKYRERIKEDRFHNYASEGNYQEIRDDLKSDRYEQFLIQRIESNPYDANSINALHSHYADYLNASPQDIQKMIIEVAPKAEIYYNRDDPYYNLSTEELLVQAKMHSGHERELLATRAVNKVAEEQGISFVEASGIVHEAYNQINLADPKYNFSQFQLRLDQLNKQLTTEENLPSNQTNQDEQLINSNQVLGVVTDENGSPIMGNQVFGTVTNENGDPIMGNQIFGTVTDENGNPVMGDQVLGTVTNENGNLVMGHQVLGAVADESGNPLIGNDIFDNPKDETGDPVTGDDIFGNPKDEAGNPLTGNGIFSNPKDEAGDPLTGNDIFGSPKDETGDPLTGNDIFVSPKEEAGNPLTGNDIFGNPKDEAGNPLTGNNIFSNPKDEAGDPLTGNDVFGNPKDENDNLVMEHQVFDSPINEGYPPSFHAEPYTPTELQSEDSPASFSTEEVETGTATNNDLAGSTTPNDDYPSNNDYEQESGGNSETDIGGDNSVGNDHGGGGSDYGGGGNDYGGDSSDYGSGGNDYGDGGSDYSSGGSDYSSGGNDYGSSGNDYGGDGNDYGDGGSDYSSGGNDYSSGGNDYSGGSDSSGDSGSDSSGSDSGSDAF
ncbi:MAG: carboxypeptidase-like regulatory domain-containing protein [Bacteroidales bacterium]|jgi:hypothetical protein|nr:carboxypeptidase-like regulatory domain-containing protein [Bacteroidales bacterium]